MNWIFWIVVGGILLTAAVATASIFISKRRAELRAARLAEVEAPAQGELLDLRLGWRSLGIETKRQGRAQQQGRGRENKTRRKGC